MQLSFLPLTLLAWLSIVAASFADATVEGTLTLDQAKPVQTKAGYKPKTKLPVEPPEKIVAMVYLERSSGSYPKREDGVLKISQQGYQFRPAVSVVQTGARVQFPNMDDEFHNVFSYSKTKRFDLGRFRKEDESPVVTLDKPGLVKTYCEIHQHMRCVLLVVDSPWFATTDGNGRFKIPGVPAGDYTLKAVLPSERTLEMAVKVPSSGTLSVEWKD